MESPNKRLKQSPPETDQEEANFVSLSVEDDEAADQYGYDQENGTAEDSRPDITAPRGPRAMYQNYHGRDARNDPRNAKDRPKSKHQLPGHEPWVLVKTKYGRRFVYNEQTKESFWRFPPEVVAGVREFDGLERQQKEKDANAKWAEEQLTQMRDLQSQQGQKAGAGSTGGDRARRRRSESLQREDEAALMAELAAEAEDAEAVDVKKVVDNVKSLQPKAVEDTNGGYASDSSYDIIEVTDSEFEDDEEDAGRADVKGNDAEMNAEQQDDETMEFGEDDIAYQLAAMEEDYDEPDANDPDEDRSQADEFYDEDGEPDLSEEEAISTFRAMLDDHGINPFTPWEKLIADESDNSIIMDDRYTVLPNMRARKAAWEAWVTDAAARRKKERKKAEALDPRVPYLTFLAEYATPKLYWPEFKRKFRKQTVLNDRRLSDKDREKLYRDHINRLKLPERTRKADLLALLKSIPLKDLNRKSTLYDLPQALLSNLHYISLPSLARDEIIASHISTLPAPPDDGEEDNELTAEQLAANNKRIVEQVKQEEALRARQRQVDEQKKAAEKVERFARRELKDEEYELRRAMEVDNRGLKDQLAGR